MDFTGGMESLREDARFSTLENLVAVSFGLRLPATWMILSRKVEMSSKDPPTSNSSFANSFLTLVGFWPLAPDPPPPP